MMLIAVSILIGCGVLAVLLTIQIQLTVRLARALEEQIKGLGATHLAGFEALIIELQRLEKRVKNVEDVMP